MPKLLADKVDTLTLTYPVGPWVHACIMVFSDAMLYFVRLETVELALAFLDVTDNLATEYKPRCSNYQNVLTEQMLAQKTP